MLAPLPVADQPGSAGTVGQQRHQQVKTDGCYTDKAPSRKREPRKLLALVLSGTVLTFLAGGAQWRIVYTRQRYRGHSKK